MSWRFFTNNSRNNDGDKRKFELNLKLVHGSFLFSIFQTKNKKIKKRKISISCLYFKYIKNCHSLVKDNDKILNFQR